MNDKSSSTDSLPVVVGVDPGTCSGWSIFLPGKNDQRYYLWRYGEMNPTDPIKTDRLFQDIAERASDREIVLAIEGQFVHRKDPLGHKTGSKIIIGLVTNRCRWQIPAEMRKHEIQIISPLKWQNNVLNAGPGKDSKWRKNESREFVKYLFNLDSIRGNEADAICIAVNEILWTLIPIAKKFRPESGEKL